MAKWMHIIKWWKKKDDEEVEVEDDDEEKEAEASVESCVSTDI